MVLSGKPDATNLQEKFLGERADAGAALAERLRTRIVQGAGRCTRGPNDFAVVVRGSDITKYFSKSENRRALEPELQAEIDFGWRNSVGAQPSEILDNVRIFLEHGQDWRDGGEPALAEFRRDALKIDPPGSAALGDAAPLEVAAWEAAYAGDWVTAAEKAVDAARVVGQGGDATRGYRGVLLYLAGVWLFQGAVDEAQRSRARALVRQAEAAAANRGTWLREMRDLPGADEVELAGVDVVAVNAIVTRLTGQLKPTKVINSLSEMRDNLDQDEASAYENGLALLGGFLGAESYKPDGPGRCDAAWLWDTAIWMTVEAKSEQDDEGVLALRYVRQANTQLEQLAHDRGAEHAPSGSLSVIVFDRQSVDPQHAPTANPNVYLATPELVAEIAADIEAAWIDFLATAAGVQNARALRGHVREVLTAFGCLPTQVAERLTRTASARKTDPRTSRGANLRRRCLPRVRDASRPVRTRRIFVWRWRGWTVGDRH